MTFQTVRKRPQMVIIMLHRCTYPLDRVRIGQFFYYESKSTDRPNAHLNKIVHAYFITDINMLNIF